MIHSKRKKLVVLSGSGISAESGIKTFRDMGGLWEEYDVTEVASPEAWEKNPELVLRFYNERRKKLLDAGPNAGHKALARLEKYFDVHIVTQNVDDLHERAGSSNVLHLHGELKKARSTANKSLVYPIDGWELKLSDKCELGSQLRPHIVWFGEAVPEIENAIPIVETAEILIVTGTSLNVYPAAGLLDYAPASCPVYLVDPGDVPISPSRGIQVIKATAGKGLPKLAEELIQTYI